MRFQDSKKTMGKAPVLFLLLFLLLLWTVDVKADAIRLPAGLTAVEGEAFAGCGEIREVYLPSEAEIPADTFQDADRTVWIHCDPGSLAQSLLGSGYDVEAGTIYRALLVTQIYADSYQLEGPVNDGPAVSSCLQHLDRTNYQVSLRRDLTASEILEACGNAFRDATDYDVSLFYYSGHGTEGGNLLGTDHRNVSMASLRNVLDAVPGRKVIIIDACYSGTAADGIFGNAVSRAVTQLKNKVRSLAGLPKIGTEESGNVGQEAADSFNAAVISAFGSSAALKSRSVRSTASAANGISSYYVMTACAADELSWEDEFTSGGQTLAMGAFTHYLCRGCGWDGVRSAATARYADTDGDGLVTFGEAFTYAKNMAGSRYNQHARSNAADLRSFSPFR